MSESFSLYVHIPCCLNICPYCSFNVVPLKGFNLKEYLNGLKQELYLYAKSSIYQGREIDTIYFGGGTPSLADIDFFKDIIQEVSLAFQLNAKAEITVEANPENLTFEKCRGLKKAGVNRLSIGAQSAIEKKLKFLGRRHNFEQIRQSVYFSRENGINNINLDLIYGLFFETKTILSDDLQSFLLLNPTHISAYFLTIDEGSFFYQLSQGNYKQYNSNIEDELIDVIEDTLKAKGYIQYEISNFAQQGFASKHNKAYWTFKDFLGIGAGAYSFFKVNRRDIKGVRFANIADWKEYLKKLKTGNYPKAYQESINQQKFREEFLLLSLRQAEGMNLVKLEEYLRDEQDKFYNAFVQFNLDGYVNFNKGYVSLTKKGRKMADYILAELF